MEWIPVVGPLLGKLMDLITIRYLLGAGFGPLLVVLSAVLSWKMLSAHRDENKEFTINSVPGLVAAVVTLGIFALGLALVIWGLFHK